MQSLAKNSRTFALSARAAARLLLQVGLLLSRSAYFCPGARLTFVQVGLLLSSLDNYCPAVGFPGQKPADLDKSRPT